MRKLLLFILFYPAFLLPAHAQLGPEQERRVDSLKNIVKTATQDTAKLKAYMAWDDIIYLSDAKLDEEINRKIVGLAESSLKRPNLSSAEQRTIRRSLTFALNALSIISMNQGDLAKAVDYQTKSLKIAEELRDKKAMGNSLNNLGAVYERKGDYPRAIEYYTRFLKLGEETNNQDAIALALNNIGVIYYNVADYKKALDYHHRSLKIRQTTKNKYGIALSMNNLGSAYHSLKQLDSAITYFKRALELRRELGDMDALSTSLNNIGAIYQEQGDFDAALPYFMQSLEVVKDMEYSHQIAMTLNNIGNVYFAMNDIDKAYDYSNRAFIAAKRASSGLMIKDAALSLYKVFEKKGDFRNALEMHELYIEMRDSLQNDEKQKDVMRQEMEYTYEKQKVLDEKEHEKQIAVTEEKKKREQIITTSAAAGLILVLIFSFFVFKRLRITRLQKDIIERQKNVVLEKQTEILDSITYAKRLQQAILPPDQLVTENIPSSFIYYKPKDIVAGDFYWMELVAAESDTPTHHTSHSHILLAAADCTGHGVPGAMVSVVCSNALNRAVLEFGITVPGKILDKTRELVIDTFAKSDNDVKDGMDISLVSINKTTREVKWSGAYNPLWYISDGKLTELKADKQSIGRTDNPKAFTTHTLKLKKGDWMFLFTDGFADQFGGDKGKKFKYKPLQELLVKNSQLPPAQQRELLDRTLNDWKGNLEQVDDICIIGLQL